MSTPWIDAALSVLITVGVIGPSLGLLGLLRKSQAGWLAAPLTLVLVLVLAGSCAAAALLGQPPSIWLSAALLTGACGLVLGFRSQPGAAAVARIACSARCQTAALLFACPLLAVVWIMQLPGPTSELPVTAHELNQTVSGSRPLVEIDPTPARTDAGRPVKVFAATGRDFTPEELVRLQARLLEHWGLAERVIALPQSDRGCNAHGWVFTGGRYWLQGDQLDMILQDNDYRAVKKPRPNDVVVYRNGAGKVQHSGVVRAIHPHLPVLVESKWGQLGRFIHPVQLAHLDAPYVSYHRSVRSTHILRGLAETPRPEGVAHGARNEDQPEVAEGEEGEEHEPPPTESQNTD